MKKILKTVSLAWLAQVSLSVAQLQPNMVQATPEAPCYQQEAPVVEQNISGKTFSVAKTVVHARPESVWQVLTDYSGAPSVFPMLKKCQVVEDHGTTKILKHRVAPSGPVGQFEYTLEVKEIAPRTLEWHRIAGDFKEVDGFWKLEPLDGGHSTLVTYSNHVNGGLFFPQLLIKRQNHLDMPSVMVALRHQAESINNTIAGRPTSARTQ